ncbi:MAG: ribosomal L7Ae/L30e/S12e/Gadd45 family protein [Lachnospiraceae bacterium]|nr:ribosomal L7Ae/L30e/S12e/Gadd45 family protein [Lachnospiraceae bacterium]
MTAEGVITQDKVLSLLGIAQKSGNIAGGETQVLESIRDGTAMCVVIAGDASDGSKKMYTDKCKYYEVPYAYYSDREHLGKAVGKDLRSALAVKDEGLCRAIMKAAPELFEEEC